MRLHNFMSTKEKRRDLRKNMTVPEQLLWNEIRHNKLGSRFRRQFAIGHYIADFYCPTKKLVIELDGTVHSTQKEYDAIRDKFMKDFGIQVLRFSNDEVGRDIQQVLRTIAKALILR